MHYIYLTIYYEIIRINGHEGFYGEIEEKQLIYLNMGDMEVNIYGNIKGNL